MSWIASWPRGEEGRSMGVTVSLVGIVMGGGGGVFSLFEWPRDRSLNKCAIVVCEERMGEKEKENGEF